MRKLVYVLTAWWMDAKDKRPKRSTLGVHEHYNSALEVAERLEGRHFNWVFDSTSGWSSEGTEKTSYTVEEFELKP